MRRVDQAAGCARRPAALGALAALVAVAALAVPAPAGGSVLRVPARSGPARSGPEAARLSRCPWVGASQAHRSSPAQLAAMVLARMTLVQKLQFVVLFGAPGIENTNTGIPSLCIPPLTLSDGPNGISNHTPGSLQLPAALGLGASFDPGLARAYGTVLGAEARTKGIDVVQAPELNLARVPVSGRIFEAFGEDPLLTGTLGAAEIRGIQSEGVMADAKHYSLYNQETARPRLREQVGRRVLEEIYNAPFAMAVQDGHVASIMCAYGTVDGHNDCADPTLYADLRRWHFTGFVRSDLGSVRGPAAAFRAGLDLLKPATLAELAGLVRRHALPVSAIDRAVRAVLGRMFAFGLVAHPRPLRTATPAITAHRLAVALAVAERSIVLLKDRGGALPLPRRVRSIAVIGTDASSDPMSVGFGSAYVQSSAVVTPLSSLRSAFPSARLTWVAGGVPINQVPRLTNADLEAGELLASRHRLPRPIEPGKADLGIVGAANVSRDVLTATAPGHGPGWRTWRAVLQVPRTGAYELSMIQDGDLWAYLDGRSVLSVPGLHGPSHWATTVRLVGRRHYRLVLRWFAVGGDGTPQIGLVDVSPMLAAAARAARRAQVAVVFVNDVNKEGVDRPSLLLPGDANALVETVAAANPDTVVVLDTGGAVLLPWLHEVRAVVEAWYPGQVDGRAVAAVLAGAVDPSGHLPVTFPASAQATPMSRPSLYPGHNGVVTYANGLDVGYRWYLAHHVRPQFPFGFGLSYTSFRLAGAGLAEGRRSVRVHVVVSNTGRRAGRAVVQAYLAYPPAAGEPPEQLRAFASVELRPGARRRVTLVLPRAGFEAFLAGRFRTVPGRYEIGVGFDVAHLPVRLAAAAPSG